ncbi:hypothetical protein [Halobacterium wangiae]|uniref:hypothetical protein n=1 Tax=Halobacterium wangiae TaxID=2902623 RepID=UPI001E4C3BA3|nr:hypothetical protein [Halobacterium wangiae]
MPVTFRMELRSTETRPSKETQESVLPAMSQKFGQRVTIRSAELGPEDRLRAATIGTVDVQDTDVLRELYEYVKPHRLVKVGSIKTNDDGGVVTRKTHEVDRENVDSQERFCVIGEVRGDLLIRVHGDSGQRGRTVRDGGKPLKRDSAGRD